MIEKYYHPNHPSRWACTHKVKRYINKMTPLSSLPYNKATKNRTKTTATTVTEHYCLISEVEA